jgi:DNA-binding transcriptional regulator LsrR (DeoR family)
MYYLDDLGQHDIARILGISRSQVSRLLARAREIGVVRISVDEYDPRDREMEARLLAAFPLRQAVVVRSQDGSPEQVRRTIGYFASPAVAGFIRSGMRVGLAGGRTLAEVVAHLAPQPAVRGVSAVQLMGNIGPEAGEIDAAELSRALAQRFGGAHFTVNAPAIVQERAARDLFLAHEHIRAVWELFSSLQLALVGIGTLEESAFVSRGVLTDVERERLRAAGAVGEICGRFFDAAGQECRDPYHERVISIELDTLRRCPEVVAVTNGAGRADAVRAALVGRLITTLVIDDAGASALLAASH